MSLMVRREIATLCACVVIQANHQYAMAHIRSPLQIYGHLFISVIKMTTSSSVVVETLRISRGVMEHTKAVQNMMII